MKDETGRADGAVGNHLEEEIRRLKSEVARLEHHVRQQDAELAQLRKSEKRLRHVGIYMPVMLEAFDEEGRLIVWNRECERVSGYSAEELVGNPEAMDLLYPDENYRTQIQRKIGVRGYDFRDIEWDITCKDGNIRTIAWYNLSKRFPVAGWSSWAVGMDVTDRKRAEEVLRESRQRFRQAFADAALGMCLFEPDLGIIEANSYLGRMLKQQDETLLGRRVADFIHPDDRDMVSGRIAGILDGVSNYAWLECRMVCRDDSLVWVFMSCSLIRDARERAVHFVCHLQDITERKRTEKALQDSNTALQVLLDHREEEKLQQERHILASLEKLVVPYIEVLYSAATDRNQKTFLEITRSNLQTVTSPMAARLTSPDTRLTPMELEVADLIRHGKTTLEISDILHISPPTVSFHRSNIREKLGLKNRRVNLRSYLNSIK